MYSFLHAFWKRRRLFVIYILFAPRASSFTLKFVTIDMEWAAGLFHRSQWYMQKSGAHPYECSKLSLIANEVGCLLHERAILSRVYLSSTVDLVALVSLCLEVWTVKVSKVVSLGRRFEVRTRAEE